jgi:hypothetical protein
MAVAEGEKEYDESGNEINTEPPPQRTPPRMLVSGLLLLALLSIFIFGLMVVVSTNAPSR